MMLQLMTTITTTILGSTIVIAQGLPVSLNTTSTGKGSGNA